MIAHSLGSATSRRRLLLRLGGALMAIPLLEACQQAAPTTAPTTAAQAPAPTTAPAAAPTAAAAKPAATTAPAAAAPTPTTAAAAAPTTAPAAATRPFAGTTIRYAGLTSMGQTLVDSTKDWLDDQGIKVQ